MAIDVSPYFPLVSVVNLPLVSGGFAHEPVTEAHVSWFANVGSTLYLCLCCVS